MHSHIVMHTHIMSTHAHIHNVKCTAEPFFLGAPGDLSEGQSVAQ